jgi:hypothetical protein
VSRVSGWRGRALHVSLPRVQRVTMTLIAVEGLENGQIVRPGVWG